MILWICLCFMMFIFAPLEIYFTNINDFWFSIYDFFPYMFVFFIVTVILFLGSYCLLKKIFPKTSKIIYVIASALTFSLYIQGNFFVVDYGQLNGEPIVWSDFKVAGIISVLLWVCIMLGCIGAVYKLGWQKYEKLIKTIALFIILIQTVTLVTVCMFSNGLQKKTSATPTVKNEFVYSGNQNFTILLVDSFDSRQFQKMIEEDEEYREVFEDFTYFPNTVSRYTATDFSVPQIITGNEYLNEEPYGVYMDHALKNADFLNGLKQSDWSLNAYVYLTMPDEISKELFDNYPEIQTGISSHKRLIIYISKLIGFRYLPQPLKQTCWFYPDDMIQLRYVKSVDGVTDYAAEDAEAFYWSNQNFYEKIDTIRTDAEKNMYHFYHLRGIHVPRYYGRDLEYVGEDVGIDDCAAGVMKLLRDYLEVLKQKNVYDNNVIIIMADHGVPELAGSEKNVSPLLLIKGMNEKHAMRTNDLAISYTQLQDAYEKLLNGEKEGNVFAENNADMPRIYYSSTWAGGVKLGDYGEDLIEYEVTGHAFESDKIRETGRIFKGK